MTLITTKMRVRGKVRASRVKVESTCIICHRPMPAIAFNRNAHVHCLNNRVREEQAAIDRFNWAITQTKGDLT